MNCKVCGSVGQDVILSSSPELAWLKRATKYSGKFPCLADEI